MAPNSIFDVPIGASNNGNSCCIASNSDNSRSNIMASQSSSFFGLLKLKTQDSPTIMPLDDMEAVVVDEMNRLTVDEREEIYEDLHGVSRPEDESQDMMNAALNETRHELTCMRLKGAYNKAAFLNPEYVNSDAFILMFLRAFKFDPKKAATTIVDHFRYKLDLFGYDNVGKDLMYDDLDQGTKNALATGAVQFLPHKDSAGRTLVFFKFDAMDYDCVESQLRATWYVMMRGLSDPAVQRSGIVNVVYNTQYSSDNTHIDFLVKSSIFDKALPQKLLGVHFFYNNKVMRPVLSMLQMITTSSTRLHLRAHFGSHMEARYLLRDFGIAYDSLPIDFDGKMDSFKVQAFVQEQKILYASAQQRKKSEAGGILHPLSIDVLMGRGWHQQQHHPGNLESSRIVDDHREEYKAARKLNKTKLNWAIVGTIRASGGRFLERSQNGWIEASDENARDKVSKSFRTKSKRVDAKNFKSTRGDWTETDVDSPMLAPLQ